MENRIEQLTEQGIDRDIAEEIAGMTKGELSEEAARLQREEEEEELNSSSIEESREIEDRAKELTAKPGAITTRQEQKALDGLLRFGANPDKALQWILRQRETGVNVADIEPREAVESQYLLPDAHYEREASKRLRNEFINKTIENRELPIELIKEMARSKTKGQAALLLREYNENLVENARDEGMKYILEQSQAFDLPVKLRRKIAGVQADNLEDAKNQVRELITNYRR